MKKLLTSLLVGLIAMSSIIAIDLAPANADITYDNRAEHWGGLSRADGWSTISVAGSIVEGESLEVKVDATIPANLNCATSWIKITTRGATYTPISQNNTGTFSQTKSLVAGQAGIYEAYAVSFDCVDINDNSHSGYGSTLAIITFEPWSGTPVNFSVTPQAGGTAFTTWGIAGGATSYTVTASPGGSSCTTSQNFCVVRNLTPGTNYTFDLFASKGSTNGPTISSGQVLLNEPLNVAVVINGGTWKVGENVTASAVIQGSPTPNRTTTWYRCNESAPPTAVAPAQCTVISTGNSLTYTLTAADVGKFISVFVLATNGNSSAGQTASGNTPVLASNSIAPTPTPAPDGKPTIISIPNPIVNISGGTQITITGTGLSGVTTVTLGGILTEVISRTDTSLVVKVPSSNQTGAVDVVVTNDKGSATKASAVIYTSTQNPNPTPTTPPVTPVVPGGVAAAKTLSISNFTAKQVTLSAAQKTSVKKLITTNPTLTKLVCTAKSTGPSMSAKDLAYAKSRAAATCAYAATLRKNLYVNSSGSAGISKTSLRNVTLTLKN